MTENTLNSLFEELFGNRKQKGIIKQRPFSENEYPDREGKLLMFFPEEVIKMITETYASPKSYFTWLLNGDSQSNNSRKKLTVLLNEKQAELIQATEDQLKKFLYTKNGDRNFDLEAMRRLLTKDFPDSCLHFQKDRKERYQRFLNFYTRNACEKALAAAVWFLLIMKRPTKSDIRNKTCTDHEFIPVFDKLFSASVSSIDVNDAYLDANAQFMKGRLLYEEGDFKNAYNVFSRLDCIKCDMNGFSFFEELYYYLGMLYKTDIPGFKNDLKSFCYLKKSMNYGNMAAYELYRYYKSSCIKRHETDGEHAKNALLAAAKQNDYRALRDLGNACYTGNKFLNIDKNETKAVQYFEKAISHASAAYPDGVSHYMLGRIRYEEGNIEEACRLFETAAAYGHPDAKSALLKMHPKKFLQSLINSDHKLIRAERHDFDKYCFFNSYNIKDTPLIKNLCKDATSFYSNDGLNSFISVVEANMPGLLMNYQNQFSKDSDKIIFYLFSSNTENNLIDALDLIEYLGILMNQKQHTDFLMDNLIVYIRLNNRVSELMIDSAIASLEPFYLKVRICNEYLDAANMLLFKAPLFLKASAEEFITIKKPLSVILLGHGHEAIWLIKAIVGTFCSVLTNEDMKITIFKHVLSLTIIDENASKLKSRLYDESIGIFTLPEMLSVDLCFYDMKFDQELIQNAMTKSSAFIQEHPELEKKINDCNYYIICSDDSMGNIETAIRLRENLLRNDKSFSKTPFIAAFCPDSHLSWRAKRLSVGDQVPGFSWYNNFNIYYFGSLSELYSMEALSNHYPDQLALEIHAGYNGIDLHKDSQMQTDEHIRKCLFSYYSCYYNRDVSRGSALSYIYHLYSIGITLEHFRDYGTKSGLINLAESYKEWLSSHNKEGDLLFELLSQAEHDRWNSFMITRGWLPASVEQMDMYMEKGTLKHHLSVARLHPYMTDWNNLGDSNHGIQFKINEALLRRNPDSKLNDIKEADRVNIRMIGTYLENITKHF